MENILATRLDIEKVLSSLDSISDELSNISPNPSHVILSNNQFCERLDISSKTAQRWRDKGWVKYSCIGRSIFYVLSDVLSMIEANSVEPSK